MRFFVETLSILERYKKSIYCLRDVKQKLSLKNHGIASKFFFLEKSHPNQLLYVPKVYFYLSSRGNSTKGKL